jgi:hypothetical protein
MINYKNIGVEYLSGALFGLFALVLSLVIGFIAGNKISLIFFRTFLNTLIFSVIGTGCVFVVKKFVPEMYQVISLSNDDENIEINTNDLAVKPDNNNRENITANPEMVSTSVNEQGNREDTELENEFNSLDKPSSGNSSFDIKENDTDNISHDIKKDKSNRYEPKIAAQAIRTMMKKDE